LPSVGGGLLLLALAIASPARAGASAAQRHPTSPSPRHETSRPNAAAIEQSLVRAVRQHPDSFEAHHALAEFYVQHGKLAAALPHFERAHAIDPGHYANAYDLALVYLETGNLDAARQLAHSLLEKKDAGELHNLLGDVEERSGNLVLASEEYQRAAHLDATEEHLFDWGNNLLQLRAYEPAAQVFTAAVARHPDSARLHVGLGIAEYSRGHYVDAVKAMCRAADLAPSDPRPHQFLGDMYGIAPELADDITTRLARFVKAAPANALAHYYYAMSLWRGATGSERPIDLATVRTHLERAVVLDPKLAKGFLQLGILLSEQQRYTEAIVPLRKASALEPDLAQAHYRLAQAYQRTGQRALAAKELELFERLKGRETGPPTVPDKP